MAREVAGTRVEQVATATVDPASAKINPSRPIGRPLSLVPQRLVPHRLTAAERHRRICDLAYRRAEQRGFAPGGEVDDWLEAEREVDAGRY
jgi:hypothetical protein